MSREIEDKIIHMAENVDKKGIFYIVKRMPEKIQKYFSWAYDKKNEDWFFQENELRKVKKITKRKGFKLKIARLNQVVMSLGDTLKEFKDKKLPRMKSKYKPLDELMNGGFVKGGIVLISGEPGAGKSTLTNQLMLRWAKKRRCVYINTEETARQVSDRYKRLNENEPFSKKQKKNLIIMIQNDLNMVRARLRKEDAEVVILDSLGGFVEGSGNISRGGVKILKEAAGLMHEYVKMNRPDAVAIMVGHINKEGRIAGPEAIQHMADTILFLQGSGRIRSIQPTKNRFGSTSGMISVAMTESGLEFEEGQQMERAITPGQHIAKIDDGWTDL